MDVVENYFQDVMVQNNSVEDDKSSFENWKSVSDDGKDLDNSSSDWFDCNICLEAVKDPVVTLCGHLYCWPCIYEWLHLQGNKDQQQPQCPVCKAEVSEASLVPLYGKGQITKPSKSSKSSNLGIVIPRRPAGIACGFDYSPRATSPHITQQIHYRNYPPQQPQQNYPIHGGDTASSPNMFDPTVGVFGEVVYARVFGNKITNLYTYPNSYDLSGNRSPRVWRHVMQADRSLNRICFFLFCCLILCLLLF